MDTTICCVILIFCTLGKLIDGVPAPNHRHRVDHQAYNWLDVPNEEVQDEPRKLTKDENLRRMQENRNR